MKKIWNVKFVAGNPEMFSKVVTDSASPYTRANAIRMAQKIGDWRVWVEHFETGKRVYENEVEKAWKAKHGIE